MKVSELDRRIWLGSAGKYTRITEEFTLTPIRDRVFVRMATVVSLGSSRTTDIIEVATVGGIRLGWSHLSYGFRESNEPVITEMFVWPTYRRRGIARALQDAAEQLVRDWGRRSIDLHIHEADSVGC